MRGLGLSPRRLRAGSGAASSYAATPVAFDGATHLARGGPLADVPDGKVWSASLWLRLAATSSVFCRAFNATDDKYQLLFSDLDGGRLALFAKDGGGNVILELRLPCTDTGWHHYLWSFDLANPGNRHAYIDDLSAGAWPIYADGIADFTAADLGWGASPTGVDPFSGDMADAWLRFGGGVIDFGLEANRRRFITAEGKPADPVGWPPGGQVQLRGSVAAWHVNKGSGGGFTETGALTAGTGPIQVP